MDDATIRDANNLLYTNPDNPYALPITILPEGGIYQRKDYRMLGIDFRGTLSWNHLFQRKSHDVIFFRAWKLIAWSVTELCFSGCRYAIHYGGDTLL